MTENVEDTTEDTEVTDPEPLPLSGPDQTPLLEHHPAEATEADAPVEELVEEGDPFPNVPSIEELEDLPSVQIFEETVPGSQYQASVPTPNEVDVGSATSDKNRNSDEKIRGLGWDKYGARLRKRRKDRGEDDG